MNYPEKPRITGVWAADRSILAIEAEEGWIEGGVQVPYVPQDGETLRVDKSIPHLIWIEKDGKAVATLVKDPQLGDQRFPLEVRQGENLNEQAADDPYSYRINGQAPTAVWRKSKPSNVADPSMEVTVTHTLYLVLPEELEDGKEYAITFCPGLLSTEAYMYTHDPRSSYSQAVHVSQLGFRPGDPSKKAFLCQWMGLGGGISYDSFEHFELLDTQSGAAVYSGPIRMQHDGTPVVFHNRARDRWISGSDELTVHSAVYEMDFSGFSLPGSYRVYVPGLGCSFLFVISEEESWLRGFRLSMEALYCQRSGIVTGPPYTQFKRPRVYHPEDGRVIRQSKCSLFESGNGQNCYGTDYNNFGNLVRKATDEVVENAWGGYFDACDWDRRIQHLRATQRQLELYLMFPDFFRELKLPIPESGSGIPDIISEGLYNLDFYRRLQLPGGGIRGGIEAEEHPILGQCGWQDSWAAFAYAPDFWSSHFYAATAARAAFALKGTALESVYRESAQKAMDWAEEQYAVLVKKEAHKWTLSARAGAKTTRELAAVEMYRLTGSQKYDALYRRLQSKHGYDAAFTYATLPEGMGDRETRKACTQTILAAAERALAFGENTPFYLTTPDPGITSTGSFSSFYTIPKITELLRAHYLTGEEKYRRAAISACNFGCGANPDNLCYTTGVGPKNVLNVLHHDSRITGQPCPPGITVFGPQNMCYSDRDGFIPFIRGDRFWPGVYGWPASESYFDVYRIAPENEYTVQGSIGPNLYNWGYLAAWGR